MRVTQSEVYVIPGYIQHGGFFPTNDVTPAGSNKFWLSKLQYLIVLQISELALMKQPKNSLQLPRPTRITRNTANK